MKPVPFIIGVPRSGTTLLRMLLDAHSNLAICGETYFLRRFKVDRNISVHHFFHHLVEDSAWINFDFFEREFTSGLFSMQTSELSDWIRYFYSYYASKLNNTRWGQKSPEYYQDMDLISELLPEVRYVYIIRDVRDVALSQSRLTGCSFQDSVISWNHEVLSFLDSYDPTRCFILRFEDLVVRPEESVRGICKFIDLPYDSNSMLYYKDGRSRSRLGRIPEDRFSWFEEVHKPPSLDMVYKYTRHFDEFDNNWVVRNSKYLLERFKYDTDECFHPWF